jgi:hypothetical protein
MAGAGAAREYARRRATDKAAMKARWGILAPIVEQFTGPRQSTHAWARGAAGEERLAAYLERELGDEAILLHDRRIPDSKANIDHIAVAPSGVWVIDPKRYTGTVRRYDRGGLFQTDVRLYVGGRDQTQLVSKLPRQIDVVREALSSVPAFSALEVRGALCFTDSDWGFLNLGKPFTIDGVIVTYPGAQRTPLREPVRLSRDLIGQVAARLAVTIPSA